MLRILFLILWVIPFFSLQARADIEIYAKGHKYDSLQGYLSSEKPLGAVSPKLSGTTPHELYVMSVENGVVAALRDFYSTPVCLSITPGQLQEAIQQAVTKSRDPKLLISKPGKLRIMDASAQDIPQ